jgi:hypothetical protein
VVLKTVHINIQTYEIRSGTLAGEKHFMRSGWKMKIFGGDILGALPREK